MLSVVSMCLSQLATNLVYRCMQIGTLLATCILILNVSSCHFKAMLGNGEQTNEKKKSPLTAYTFSQQFSSLDYQVPTSHHSAPPLPPKNSTAPRCPSSSSQSQTSETNRPAKHSHSRSVSSQWHSSIYMLCKSLSILKSYFPFFSRLTVVMKYIEDTNNRQTWTGETLFKKEQSMETMQLLSTCILETFRCLNLNMLITLCGMTSCYLENDLDIVALFIVPW